MLLMGVCIVLAMQNLTSMPRVEDHNQDLSSDQTKQTKLAKIQVDGEWKSSPTWPMTVMFLIWCASGVHLALPVFACCSLYVILVLV